MGDTDPIKDEIPSWAWILGPIIYLVASVPLVFRLASVFVSPDGLTEVGRRCLQYAEVEASGTADFVLFYDVRTSRENDTYHEEHFWVALTVNSGAAKERKYMEVECSQSLYDGDWEFDSMVIDRKEIVGGRRREIREQIERSKKLR